MNVLISGGTGFLGSALTRSLLADGHSASILSRNPARRGLPAGVKIISWDGRTSQGWLEAFEAADAAVNLVGETIGRWPWSAQHKKRIYDSRIQAAKAMLEAYERASRKPPVYLQASGVGFYGPLGSQPVGESAPPGSDFMAEVARDWEAASAALDSMTGVRRIVIRNSIVLDASQGILPLMALPVRLFAGGRLGSGAQGTSWIHIEDEVRAIRFLIDNDRARGPFNLSSPHPVSNAEFYRALAKALRRPYWLPTPAFALRLALGGMSTLLLDGQFALPVRLQELGFGFKYGQIGPAFENLYHA